MSARGSPPATLRGRWLLIARVAWVVVALVARIFEEKATLREGMRDQANLGVSKRLLSKPSTAALPEECLGSPVQVIGDGLRLAGGLGEGDGDDLVAA